MLTPLFLLVVAADTAPAHADTFLEQAEVELDAGDITAARAAAERAVAADPENLEARKIAAVLAARQGDHATAAQHLEQVLAKDPLDDEARLLLARARYDAGDDRAALATVETLLGDLPEQPEALALLQTMRGGDHAGTWRPLVRGGLAMAWDSNLAQVQGTAPSGTSKEAASGEVELVAGVLRTGGAWPVTLLAHLVAANGLTDRDLVQSLMPSVVGASATVRHPMENLAVALDLRYQEIFVDNFSEHRERLVTPVLWASHRASSAQAVRLLAGVESRWSDAGEATFRSVAPRLTLRDEIVFGSLLAIAEIGARKSFGATDAPIGLGDLDELRAQLYGEYRFTADLEAFLAGAVEGRRIALGPDETTWRGQAGARWSLGDVELHAEYGFAKNVSKRERSYDRHQVGLGVRFLYF